MPDIRKAVPCRGPMVSKMKMSGASYSSLISGIVLGYRCHPMISTSFMQIENQRKIACHGKTSKCWWRLVVWCGNVEAASMCPPYFNTFLWHWLNSLLSATWADYHQDKKKPSGRGSWLSILTGDFSTLHIFCFFDFFALQPCYFPAVDETVDQWCLQMGFFHSLDTFIF